MTYWMGVVSRDHVRRGISLGIAQIGHGKRAPLARMKPGDWLIYYSPKQDAESKVPLQSFTAVGEILDDEIWQADEGPFKPWRRHVRYIDSQDAPIIPLLPLLSFTHDRKNWGFSLRFGLIPITETDFATIVQAMNARHE